MAKKRAADGQGSIRQRSDGRWEARYYVNGVRKSIISKKNSPRPKEEVTKALNKALYELENGLYVEPNKIKLSDWLDKWLKEYKANSLKPSTYDSYDRVIKLYINPTLGKRNLKDIRPEELQTALNKMTRDGLSARTVKYANQVLHSALTQAIKNGLLVKNIADMVILPKGDKREMRVLTKNEQDTFLKYLKGQRYEFAFIFCLSTGLRVGELLGLRWKDVDFKEGTIKINQTLMRLKDSETGKTTLQFSTPKTEKGKRTIPLLDDILLLLKNHKQKQLLEKFKAGSKWQNKDAVIAAGQKWKDNDLVFRTELGNPVEPKNLTRIINKTVEKINQNRKEQYKKLGKAMPADEKFKNFGIHALRHTFATRALEAGMQPKVLQEILGHSTIGMTLDTYSHVLPDTKKDSMNLLKGVFLAAKEA